MGSLNIYLIEDGDAKHLGNETQTYRQRLERPQSAARGQVQPAARLVSAAEQRKGMNAQAPPERDRLSGVSIAAPSICGSLPLPSIPGG